MLPPYKETRTARQLVNEFIGTSLLAVVLTVVIGVSRGWDRDRMIYTVLTVALSWFGRLIFIPVMTAKPKAPRESDKQR